MRTILNMGPREAKKFFLKPKSYLSLELPSYYQFDQVLKGTQERLSSGDLLSCYRASSHPRIHGDINFPIICNKDGEYSWRRHQAIHPFFYIGMVQLLTGQDDWRYITSRLKSFRNSLTSCASFPLAPTRKLSKNEQDIFNWSGNFTNATIRKALEYRFMLATDITNCYDSLCTHFVAWALHGKENIHAKYPDPDLIGNKIDMLLQDMSYGQTCGIPQGSAMMDFLAEIILNYIDSLVADKLKAQNDLHILRYRDDYRIFANDVTVARLAMKALVETLAEFNLKINLAKTHLTSDIIKHAFKPDRLAWHPFDPLLFGEDKLSVRKSLLLINDFSKDYPNCGSVRSALSRLYNCEVNETNCHRDDIWQVASIVAEIMYRNPSAWPHCVAILSKYLEINDNPAAAISIVEHILEKFSDIPNTDYLEVWLQRLTVKVDPYYKYHTPLCNLVHDPAALIWNSDWLAVAPGFADQDIINYDEILSMPRAIPPEEVAFFVTSHGSGG